MSELKQYYSTPHPKEGELVLVEFLNKSDIFIDAKLLEYPYRGMMNHVDATKKRRYVKWNKVVPLNKQMVARVDSIDMENMIVQLSLAYLDDNESKTTEELQKSLLKTFNSNRIFENIVKSYCIINSINFIEYWTNYIYKLDTIRTNLLLLDTFELNRDTFEDKEFVDFYNKRNQQKQKKYTSTINIISNKGIVALKDYIISMKRDNISIIYISASTYTVESNEGHTEYIEQLKKIAPNDIYIK